SPRTCFAQETHARLIHRSLLSRSSRESTRTLCKHFTSVSPAMSGHECQTDRAPMLVGTPLPVILSVFVALGPALWIRRVLVRSQEGQLKRRPRPSLFIAPP